MSGGKWCPVGQQECIQVWEDSLGRNLCSRSNANLGSLEICGNPSAKRAPVKSDAELLKWANMIIGVAADYSQNDRQSVWYDRRDSAIAWLRDYRAAHPEGGR